MDPAEHRSSAGSPETGRADAAARRGPAFVPPTGRLTVARYASGFGYSASEWSAALRGVDWRGGARIYKRGRKGTVWRASLRVGGARGREADGVIKVEPLGTPGKRILSLMHRTKAWRQWRGAERLREAGLGCTEPWAIVRGRGPGGWVEAFIGGWIEGPTVLERLADPGLTPAEESRLAGLVGDQLAAMWSSRPYVINGDHKPSNLVVSGDRLRVIDTLDISNARPLRPPMFEDLLREPLGCGLRPSAAACRVVLRRASIPGWLAREVTLSGWRREHAGLRRQLLDRAWAFRPEDDPLARPERLTDPTAGPELERSEAGGR